jgi:hypothetical protein
MKENRTREGGENHAMKRLERSEMKQYHYN